MNAGRLRHTVSFTLRHAAESPEESAFLSAAQELAAIDGVEEFELLRQIGAKNSFRFGISMEFADQGRYDLYNEDPAHVRFVAERWIPEVSEFLELDYAVLDSLGE
jgi:hypothetical protein